MKLRMLKTRKGAEDGIHVKEYREGEVYTFSPGQLAEAWVKQGIAEPVAPAPDKEQVIAPTEKKIVAPKKRKTRRKAK